jgi:hypothetical protein
MKEQAKILFYDGQRVGREDLAFLQENLLQNQAYLRAVLGKPGVIWGFQVSAVDNGHIRVGKGLAFDLFARPVIHPVSAILPISLADDSLFLCVKYLPEVTREHNGQPSRVENGYQFVFHGESDLEIKEGVILAQIRPREGGYDVIQKGDWYIPPIYATHSGRFFEDSQGLWRYDGDPVVSAIAPDFDSGWIPLEAHSDVNLPHGLGSNNLLVQLQNRLPGSSISSKGNGVDFYYELHDTSIIRLLNVTDRQLTICVKLWRLDAQINPLLAPVADAGMDINAEHGESFDLDGSDSMAFQGRSVVRYRWSLFD